MRRTLRRLRGRNTRLARPVSVRAKRSWYWRVLMVLVPLAAGYAIAYWQISGNEVFHAGVAAVQIQAENRAISKQLVLAERQLQIERATRSSASREMAALQDEILRLKEDVAFYKGILDESGSAGVAQLHSVKLAKGSRPGEYQYQILLVQSGRHDKMVKGRLRLVLQVTQDGKSMGRNIEGAGGQHNQTVSFKYYQRVAGTFNVPADVQAQTLVVEFNESDKQQRQLTQVVKLPV